MLNIKHYNNAVYSYLKHRVMLQNEFKRRMWFGWKAGCRTNNEWKTNDVAENYKYTSGRGTFTHN